MQPRVFRLAAIRGRGDQSGGHPADTVAVQHPDAKPAIFKGFQHLNLGVAGDAVCDAIICAGAGAHVDAVACDAAQIARLLLRLWFYGERRGDRCCWCRFFSVCK